MTAAAAIATIDLPVHSEDTLAAALATLRRIIFERDNQHVTWPDEANLALAQFADLIDEVKTHRAGLLDCVEIAPLGEAAIAAAGDDEAALAAEPLLAGSDTNPCRSELARLTRMSGRRGNALAAIRGTCETLLSATDFGGAAAPHFLDAMRELCIESLSYDGVIHNPASPRPETV